jgi:hypothetical protein
MEHGTAVGARVIWGPVRESTPHVLATIIATSLGPHTHYNITYKFNMYWERSEFPCSFRSSVRPRVHMQRQRYQLYPSEKRSHKGTHPSVHRSFLPIHHIRAPSRSPPRVHLQALSPRHLRLRKIKILRGRRVGHPHARRPPREKQRARVPRFARSAGSQSATRKRAQLRPAPPW